MRLMKVNGEEPHWGQPLLFPHSIIFFLKTYEEHLLRPQILLNNSIQRCLRTRATASHQPNALVPVSEHRQNHGGRPIEATDPD